MRPPPRVTAAIHAVARRLGVQIAWIPSDQWLRAMPIRTVLDVGANIGQFAHTARQLFPESSIYSFEPLRDCFDQMTKAFQTDTRWHGFQCALGAEDGEVVFHRSASSAASSVLTMTDLTRQTWPHTAGGNDEPVPVRRLDDVLADVPLLGDVLLKMDVQGYEDRVLDGAGRVLTQTRIVITEVSFARLYHNQALFGDMYQRLTRAGFGYHGNWEQLRRRTDGLILQADAIFMRP